MSRKIVFVLPWVLTLALVVGISAHGKVALTDAQMSSVYGGGRNCYGYGTGCDPVLCLLDCTLTDEWWAAGCGETGEEEKCLGFWNTSCTKSQRRCGGLSPNSSGGCSNRTVACGTYQSWACGWKGEPPECEAECAEENYLCAGSYLWCVET